MRTEAELEELLMADDGLLDTSVPKFNPPKGLTSSFGKAYVERTRLFKTRVVPGVIAGALAFGAWQAASGIHEHHLNYKEKNAEISITQAYEDARTLSSSANRISDATQNLPDLLLTKAEHELSESKKKISDATAIISKYIDNSGNPERLVTRENMAQAKAAGESASALLLAAKQNNERAQAQSTLLEGIRAVDNQLDSTIQRIRNSNGHVNIVGTAETTYSQSQSFVSSYNLEGAQITFSQLKDIEGQITQFTDLSQRLRPLYLQAREDAQESDVDKRFDTLYETGQRQIESADVTGLSTTVSAIQNLQEAVNQEYQILLTPARLNGQMKNGVDRHEHDSRGRKTGNINWYAFVSAYDPAGNLLAVDIENEEHVVLGKQPTVEKVKVWGERITPGRLNAIKDDLQDNGIIDNRLFGEKERGYLNIDVAFPEGRMGQITRW